MQTHQPTILQKIVQDKKIWLEKQQQALPLAQFQAQLQKSDLDFYAQLSQGNH